MSVSKIIKEYRKLYSIYKKSEFTNNILLFGDSKVLCINNILNERLKEKIEVIAQCGATVENETVVDKLLLKVKEYNSPIVIIC